jgi:nitrogen fixation protein FixH
MTTLFKRFNWGYGIALVYAGFAGGMLFLVYLCVQQKIELVQPDYYAQELRFQQRIDEKSNTAALAQRLEISYSRAAHAVSVQLPEELNGTQSMQMRFYRPDDSQLDQTIRQIVSASNSITVNTAAMKSGLWRLEMTWQHGGKNYFQETVLNL